jgi:hypothetical protein
MRAKVVIKCLYVDVSCEKATNTKYGEDIENNTVKLTLTSGHILLYLSLSRG